MKTIKIIDLLNKIANGEEVPLVIKCEDVEFALEDNEYYYEDCENHDYYALFDYFAFEKDKKSYEVLNLEVEEVNEEIIEEEQDIEHYDYCDNQDVMTPSVIANNFQRLNEDLDIIVKAVNELKKNER